MVQTAKSVKAGSPVELSPVTGSEQSGSDGGKYLWNRCVLSLEWKREETMDGVMLGPQMMNEVDGMRQEDYSKDCVMHIGKSDL